MSIDIEENKSSIKSRYRPEIDGLRAFAVVAVIINHFNKEILPNGYLGVDIFFVISGFVITSSLYQRPSKNFKDFISGFYARRIKRLVPTLSVFVLIMSIAICLFNPSSGTSLKTGLTSLFGLSNLYLLNQSTDYFAQSTKLNVFTHTWSLGVEEQFYILFPFLIWFSGFGRQTKNGARNLFLIVGTLTIASLIGFIYLYPINQQAAYFLMPSRFWEMASGCLLFICFQKSKYIEQLLEKVPPLLVMAFIVGIMYLPMSWATTLTITVVVLSLVLIASLKKGTGSYTFFTNSIVVYIGLISYSLYLWHWGVLSISRWTIGIHWWTVPFQAALMFGLAIASYRYIETPLRKGNWFVKRWETLAVGGGVLITLSGGLIALGGPLKGKIYLGKKSTIITSDKFKNLTQSCYGTRIKSADAIEDCLSKSDAVENKTIWLVGDSHASVLIPTVANLAQEKSHNFFTYSAERTAFPSISHLHNRIPQTSQNTVLSAKYMNDIEKYILESANTKDLVIIAIRHPYHFGDSEYDYPESGFSFKNVDSTLQTDQYSKKKYMERYELLLNKFASNALEKNINVLIIAPQPEFPQYLNCPEPQWFNYGMRSKNYQSCTIDANNYYGQEPMKRIINMLERVIRENQNVFIVQSLKVLCRQSICHYTDKDSGMNIYADNNHLSSYGTSLLGKQINKTIIKNDL